MQVKAWALYKCPSAGAIMSLTNLDPVGQGHSELIWNTGKALVAALCSNTSFVWQVPTLGVTAQHLSKPQCPLPSLQVFSEHTDFIKFCRNNNKTFQ